MPTHHNDSVFIQFPLQGAHIPADHGEGLYAAIKMRIPLIGGSKNDILIYPINPKRVSKSDKRLFDLLPSSRLQIACLATNSMDIIKYLYGKTLTLNGHKITLMEPDVVAITPKRRLYSRLVILDKQENVESFMEMTRSMLKTRKISYEKVETWDNRYPDGTIKSKTKRLKGHLLVGYPLTLTGLSDKDSISLQRFGFGKHLKYGCGCFE